MTRGRPARSRAVFRTVLSLAALAALSVVDSPGASSDQVPRLPLAAGTVLYISSERELQQAVSGLESNTTIMLAAGTYFLTRTLTVNGPLTNVAIRGATDNAADVVLVGRGMANADFDDVPHGMATGGAVHGFTVANLTIKDVFAHAILLDAGAVAPRIYNVVLANGGRPLIKAFANERGGVPQGVVQYSVFDITSNVPDAEIGGLEVAAGHRWVVQDSIFRNIAAPQGQLAGPAVLMWRGSRETVVERNTFVDCQREVVLGLEEHSPSDHQGGVVRNNFIARRRGIAGGPAISLANSPGTRVLHNTILVNGGQRALIESRFRGTKGVIVRNNLLDGEIVARQGATGSALDNYTNATPAMFVDPASGNLHLAAGAGEVMDRVAAIAEAGNDFDNDSRPHGAGADYGADESAFGSDAPAGPRPRAGADPPNTAPTVSITALSPGPTCSTPCTLVLSATAADPDGRITRVEFYAGRTLIGSRSERPFTATWRGVPAGVHALRAVAHDDRGAATSSAEVVVTASGRENQPPAVTLTVPVHGATYAAPATIELGAVASDPDGTIARVEFFAGSTVVGTVSTSPYRVLWRDAAAGTYTVSAKAWDAAGAATISAGVNVTVAAGSALADGWQTLDVGGPLVEGSATFSSETFTITGAGSGIGERSDQFRFVYQVLDGDGEISACVAALDYVDSWAKAGVMMRESLAADAPHAFSLLSAGWGVAFHHRPEPGAGSGQAGVAPGVAPHCLRLVRKGNVFSAYQSADGTKWVLMGTQALPMSSSVYVGLAVTSHDMARPVRAIVNRVSIGRSRPVAR